MTTETHRRIKRVIVESLRLEDLDPESIGDEQSLFGEGLGLDSVDALELLLGLENEFGFKVQTPEKDRDAFRCVNTLVDFVESRIPERSKSASAPEE